MAVSTWSCKVDQASKKATLTCFVHPDWVSAEQPVIKGVCYSPCPLNGSNESGPNIGDWFWDDFSVPGAKITGWNELWKRDLSNIRNLKANAIRVYCMLSRQLDGRKEDHFIPNPWNKGHLFTHQQFLNLCYDSHSPYLFVLVGIPLPDKMFWKNKYDQTSAAEKEYWTEVLRETVKTTSEHAAVMGYTIQNEQDGASVCYEDANLAKFWWGQAEHLAKIVKEQAPYKLVGMAVHDNPKIPGEAASYMANCPHIDFWGVNTYQTHNFDSIFYKSNDGPGYSGLSGGALKPVILTEYGLPATGRPNGNRDPSKIFEDSTTRGKTAAVVGRTLPQVYNKYPLCLGLFYFEYCDEWWKQPGRPDLYTWYGGKEEKGFPNGWWDDEGFGLYSIRRGSNLNPNDPIWDGNNNRPVMPVDKHEERKEITAKVRETFLAAKPSV